jgi:hypothetical protein
MRAEDYAILDSPDGWLDREFEPFSQLKFLDLGKLFCFLRRGVQPQDTQVAPTWSRFDDDVLMQVREKMETVFLLPLVRF